jgi:hypothetical protein
MAVEIKYVCDKCHKSQETSEQMWEIAIAYNHYGYNAHIGNRYHQQLWCRDCMTSVAGFFEPVKKDAPPSPAPTLEDIIRELIREELPR